jgi:hypothetical protein
MILKYSVTAIKLVWLITTIGTVKVVKAADFDTPSIKQYFSGVLN